MCPLQSGWGNTQVCTHSINSSSLLFREEMATHSSTLAWRIPRTEEPDGLQSMGSQRVGHKWAHTHTGARTHTHLQIAFHMPGSWLRNKTFLIPVLHLREQTWRNRVTCSESQIQESSDQRFPHRQPSSGAHTLNCDLVLLPGAPPTSKPETFSGQDRTGQSSLDSVPTKQVTVYLHSSRSCQRCALGLAKEQMFNNFAVARHRLRNMAELFLNFGKCWLFFPKCHL